MSAWYEDVFANTDDVRFHELKKILAAEIPKYTNIDLLNLNLTISDIITLRKS